jgi:hypothetical protein
MTEIAHPNPRLPTADSRLPTPAFHDSKHHIKIYEGDCLEILAAIPPDCVDLIFADPPYFLSNDGITCHAGRMVSVNKGDWDRSQGPIVVFPSLLYVVPYPHRVPHKLCILALDRHLGVK